MSQMETRFHTHRGRNILTVLQRELIKAFPSEVQLLQDVER